MIKFNSKPVKAFFYNLFHKIVVINDTPQKISLGLGVGVFCGILPGTGPIAAFFLAMLFRVNRAAALLGSLFTNTWLSVLTFFLSIKLGSTIMKLDWQEAYKNWVIFLRDFHWLNLFKPPILEIVLPVIIGYLVIAFCLGLFSYLAAIILLMTLQHRKIAQ